MVFGLPKHSAFMAHYVATRNFEREDGGETHEPKLELTPIEAFNQEVMERQEWSDTDLHIATAINSINGLWASYINTHSEKKFDPSPVGPDFILTQEQADERRKKLVQEARKARKKAGEKATSVKDFYSMMGALAPGGTPEQ